MAEEFHNTGFGVSMEDLKSYDWQSFINSASSHDCITYVEIFAAQAKALKTADDILGQRVFGFLWAVASFYPNFDSREHPFRPMITRPDGSHTTVPEELTKEDCETLKSILPDVQDAEFRARIADVLWVSRKDYKAAQAAVDSYIDAAKGLESDDLWPPFAERLRRALQVGAQLGYKREFHQKAIAAIEQAIARHELKENGLLCARLMHCLLFDRVAEPHKYGLLAEKLALRMEGIPNWHFARDYWNLKAAFSKPDEARAAQLKIANTFIKLAEGFTTGEKVSFQAAGSWMNKAVHTLREAKAPLEDIDAAHVRMLEYQKKGMAEMETIHVPLDAAGDLQGKLEQASKEAASHVAEKHFEDAIIRFAFVTEPTRVAELRKRVENANNGVFIQLFATTTVRSDGQTSDIKPPLASSDPAEKEEAVLKEMYSQSRTVDWNVKVGVYIEPARQMIMAEHPARLIDLVFLVQDNPFVPTGREALFLRGLHAGLHGDLVVALHLLLPQIENSIRKIFEARGIITSKLESDDTQDERDLGWLLTHAEMVKIFGEGMAFDLRGLLVERFGLNLRNDIAHGFLAESQMMTEGAIYVWWLILRLCCYPIARAKQEKGA